ncbi:MAG: hypothetical protein ACXWCY_17820 [Burkholderiales bacterium]
MNDPKPDSPRVRLQALLAVPERDRTESQWDELNELEIMLASGNRESAPQPHGDRQNGSPSGGRPKPGGQQHGKKPPKKFHRRPPKNNRAPDR